MKYSKEDIAKKVNDALADPATLYAQDFMNYRGNDNGERYTEIAAKEIVQNHLSKLGDIKTIIRDSSYKTESHEELAKRERPEDSNRDEEWIAISMYEKTFKHIGKIIDFQTPLKNVETDKAGKIDLLSYNESENTLYILELKKPESEETLLRCVLEAYTYLKTVDQDKLARDFGYPGASVKAAALVFESSQPHEDWKDEKQIYVKKLMNELKIGLYTIDDDWELNIEKIVRYE